MKRARGVLALVLLALFCYISLGLLPYFVRNLRLQRHMENLAQSAGSADAARAQVLDRAGQLGLPVKASDVHAELAGARVRLSARYVVPVSLPGYTVKLHFSPSAGR